MPKESAPLILPLIRSLKKGEKRYFKLLQQQTGNDANKKFVWLFNYLEEHDSYDPDKIIKTYPEIKVSQLANLKTHLYKKLLQSLSQYAQAGNSFISLRETVNHIQILYEKGLHDHCWKLIRRAKKMARQVENLEMLLLILKWERTLLIDISGVDNISRVNDVVVQVEELTRVINNVNKFSNLAIRIHAMIIRSNYVRNQEEGEAIRQLLESELPSFDPNILSFHERLHLYELYAHYFHFLQAFEESYQYSQKWVNLFDEFPHMMNQEVESYVNGLATIMKNEVRLGMLEQLEGTMDQVDAIWQTREIGDSLRVKLIKYRFTYQFHKFFLEGNFTKGSQWYQENEDAFEWAEERLDPHSRMVLYYQLGSLFFGTEDYRRSLKWLNKIINMPGQDAHEDIISFARILSLICHYELNNLDVIDYYIKSTYRLLLQKTDMREYQTTILHFLKKLNIDMTDEELFEAFEELGIKMQPLVKKEFEKRAFYYFDILSWLESKISNVPVEQVIRNKSNNKRLLQ